MGLTKRYKNLLIAIVILCVFIIGFWVYNNITWIVIGVLIVLGIGSGLLLYKWFWDRGEGNIWWYLIFVIPLFPIFFALNIWHKFDIYDKYFKNGIKEGFINGTKAVICFYRPKVCERTIRKEIKKEIKYGSGGILDGN